MRRPLSPVFLILVLSNVIQAIQIDGNGYELTIAISEQVASVRPEERVDFIAKLQETITRTSQLLFQVTDHTFYFKKVDILIPRLWAAEISTSNATITLNYLNADIRVEDTYADDDATLINTPRTSNSKWCGQPGEYIVLPTAFFANDNNMITLAYGDTAKVLIQEFARYRYGVFEEYGFPNEVYPSDKFPYAYVNTENKMQVTSCNNSEIVGSVTYTNGEKCSLGDDGCRFRPDLTSTTGPTTSLMFMQFLPTANQFCDASNHDRVAPNKQNYYCRNRSVKTVMKRTPDFRNKSPAPANTNTVPSFNIVLPASQAVYIVLDTSTHALPDSSVFDAVKSTISQNLIGNLAVLYPRTYVGIATMGGTDNSNNGLLGNYLTERLAPAQFNQAAINTVLNGITRTASGLLLNEAVLDIGDTLTNFAQLSGSVVLLVKLSTNTDSLPIEADTIRLLNSRNIRLVTVEIGSEQRLQRISELTNGMYYNASATDSSAYLDATQSAIGAVLNFLGNVRYQCRRIGMLYNPVTVQPGATATNVLTVDWRQSKLQINFFIPIAATGFSLFVNSSAGVIYDFQSPEYSQTFSTWNGLYRIHTFSIEVLNPSNWAYSVRLNSGASALSGFVEAVEILPDSAPIYPGGGGSAPSKPVEVQVFTSGVDGSITVTYPNEDQSLIIYASIFRGSAVAGVMSITQATVFNPRTGFTTNINLVDDGKYPDMVRRDGIFSGFVRPESSTDLENLRVSLTLQGNRPRAFAADLEDPSALSMPIDQDNYCCGQNSDSSASTFSFHRLIPYAASVRIDGSVFFPFVERPVRILDLAVTNVAADGNSATLTWTAPTSLYGTTTPVASYRIAYSAWMDTLIDEDGLIASAATAVTQSDVISGSLIPLTPGSSQTVTIRLQRTNMQRVFLTVGSISFNNSRPSYPSPMVYIMGTTPDPTTTTSTTTPSPVTTTTATTTTSTTTRTTTTTTTTTTTPTTTTPTTTTIGAPTTTTPVPTTDGSTSTTCSFFMASLAIVLALFLQ